MAWASKKQYAICMESEEGKDLIEKLPKLSQDEFQVEFGKLLGKTGASYDKNEDEDYKEDKDDDLPWWDKPDEDEVKEAYGKDYEKYQWNDRDLEEEIGMDRELDGLSKEDKINKVVEDYAVSKEQAERVINKMDNQGQKMKDAMFGKTKDEDDGFEDWYNSLDEKDRAMIDRHFNAQKEEGAKYSKSEDKTFNENGIRKAGKDDWGTIFDLNEKALSSNDFKEILYGMDMNVDHALEEYLFEKGEDVKGFSVTDKTRDLIKQIYKI